MLGTRGAAKSSLTAKFVGGNCFIVFDTKRHLSTFASRHIGPREAAQRAMLATLQLDSLADLGKRAVPDSIRADPAKEEELKGIPDALSEQEALAEIRALAAKNKVYKSYVGMGYHPTLTPSVVQRNMLENPQWYTAYTPYQAEISQGRLEMLLNFQTMVCDLVGADVANCSLLDEGSAAAEAIQMCESATKSQTKRKAFFVSQDCHPQTIACVKTRGENAGIKIVIGDAKSFFVDKESARKYSGVLLQYPDTFGSSKLNGAADGLDTLGKILAAADTKFVVAADLMACTLLRPPMEFGADIVVGSAQRFGVPMFFGGPHAGFMAVKQNFVRVMPGRIIGVSKDAQGQPALRMALQAREQFIRREKATSNICTAQALLANIAAAYAVYHGPSGLTEIALTINSNARKLHAGLSSAGVQTVVPVDDVFDTVVFSAGSEAAAKELKRALAEEETNVRVGSFPEWSAGGQVDSKSLVGVSFGEGVSSKDVDALLATIVRKLGAKPVAGSQGAAKPLAIQRSKQFLTHPVFNTYQSETQMLRYLASLEAKDLTLKQAMIPLGSCTMKLNATSELLPMTWPNFANLHPFAPADQTEGFTELITRLNGWLASLTGFDAVSSQPNSGATGEYAGLLAIKRYHESRGQGGRNVCLIPVSAHGTNPASAAMLGMKVVGVKSDAEGNVDIKDLKEKAEQYKDQLSAFMITYPSTYGKFEEGIKEYIQIVHAAGGQVYMDGANMNAQLGLTSPGRIGADVCHLNLHKTFAIPHGGGGPGVGSIGVKAHLAPFLPGHPVVPVGGDGKNTAPRAVDPVAAAPFGSAGILSIPYMFIQMMGRDGLRDASRVAMLNANYMAKKLEGAGYKILFRGAKGLSAHEFILDLRYLSEHKLSETDVAKRLADFGFHAPTMSWPVPGTMMVEPTESEDLAECDRFCEAMICIKKEIDDVVSGKMAPEDSPLHHAPHTQAVVTADAWDRKYSRQQAAFPRPPPLGVKYWPTVGRIDNTHGDRNLVCTCPTVEEIIANQNNN